MIALYRISGRKSIRPRRISSISSRLRQKQYVCSGRPGTLRTTAQPSAHWRRTRCTGAIQPEQQSVPSVACRVKGQSCAVCSPRRAIHAVRFAAPGRGYPAACSPPCSGGAVPDFLASVFPPAAGKKARQVHRLPRCIRVLIQFSADTWIRSSTKLGLPPSAMNWSMAACSSTWNSSRHSPFSMM